VNWLTNKKILLNLNKDFFKKENKWSFLAINKTNFKIKILLTNSNKEIYARKKNASDISSQFSTIIGQITVQETESCNCKCDSFKLVLRMKVETSRRL
jgi:hypothetical protein